MKVRMSRSHTIRPVEYESVMIHAAIDIDQESETDKAFREMTMPKIGEELSISLDELLDPEVERVLRLHPDSPHVVDSHIWVFYEKE